MTATTTCDPRALSVAQAVHRREQPDATILFGSRARGDYDDRRSDIDIMLVSPGVPDLRYKETVSQWAERVAQTAYGRRVPVQITWFAQAEFQDKKRYINHVTTRALLDGVLMTNRPEDYDCRYADDTDESTYEYQWTDYDNRLHHAEAHLRVFAALDDAGEEDMILGQQAHSALEHGMKAVIAAHGGTYPSTHNLAHLLGTLRRIDSQLRDFALSIAPDIYSEYAGDREYADTRTQPTLTEQPAYRERTAADARCIIEWARCGRSASGDTVCHHA